MTKIFTIVFALALTAAPSFAGNVSVRELLLKSAQEVAVHKELKKAFVLVALHRNDAEVPKAAKACSCSEDCTCGCNSGLPCKCEVTVLAAEQVVSQPVAVQQQAPITVVYPDIQRTVISPQFVPFVPTQPVQFPAPTFVQQTMPVRQFTFSSQPFRSTGRVRVCGPGGCR